MWETSRAIPGEAQRVIADPKATAEQLQKAYSQEIVMVTLPDKEYDKMYDEIELLKNRLQLAETALKDQEIEWDGTRYVFSPRTS